MSPYAGYLLETFVTLGAVCVLAVAVLWGARRLGLGRPSGPISLRGHLPLDARRSIYLVQVGAQVFVVGVGEGGFTKLGEMPEGELPAAGETFAEVVARRIGERRKRGAEAQEAVPARAEPVDSAAPASEPISADLASPRAKIPAPPGREP